MAKSKRESVESKAKASRRTTASPTPAVPVKASSKKTGTRSGNSSKSSLRDENLGKSRKNTTTRVYRADVAKSCEHIIGPIRESLDSDIIAYVWSDEGEAGIRLSLIGRVEHWLRRSLGRMSDAEVLKAVEAQSPAETIAEILVATPETRSASENDWAELLLRGAESKRLITELVGGLLTSSQAAEVLRISVPGVKQRMDRRKLLAVPLPGGQWGFPALQFQDGGKVRPGVAEVVRAGSHVDPWVLVSILVDDVVGGSGGMLMERLDEPAVLADVLNRLATYGTHGAA